MAFVPSAAILRAIGAAGCNHLSKGPKGRQYAQFGVRPTASQLAALDRLPARAPELWLRVYGYGDICDVDYLHALPHARKVCIDHYPIRDFTGLAGLSQSIEELEIRSSARVPIEDIVLRPSLRALRLHARAPVRDYPRLRHLRRLEVLVVEQAALSHDACNALGELTHLRELSLDRGSVADWSFLRRLRRLRTLSVARLLDAPRPADLAAVRSLSLNTVPFRSLKGLESLTNLGLHGVRDLGSLAPIASMTDLRALTLSRLPHRTLPALARLGALSSVTLWRMAQLQDLRGLAGAKALEQLSIFEMRHLDVADFRPLVGHPRLSHLRLGVGGSRKRAAIFALLGIAP